MNRLKSPVLIGATLGVILTQVTQLSQQPTVTYWDIAISALTVAIAFFGAINNPTDKEHL